MAESLGGKTTNITRAIKYLRAARRELQLSQNVNPYSSSNMHALHHVDRAMAHAVEERDIIRDKE